jgi:hypothetical protein
MNIQHSFPNNLINYDKNNYRKYKQVHVNEKIFNNSPFKLNIYTKPTQTHASATNNPIDINATCNSTINPSSVLCKRNQNSNDFLNRSKQNDVYSNLSNHANRHYDVDYHNQKLLQPPPPPLQLPLQLKEQEKRINKFETILNNAGCCPIHFNHENNQHTKINEQNLHHTDRYSQTLVNNLSLNERVLDLSGYLIFVTTSHHGDEIKVYG